MFRGENSRVKDVVLNLYIEHIAQDFFSEYDGYLVLS